MLPWRPLAGECEGGLVPREGERTLEGGRVVEWPLHVPVTPRGGEGAEGVPQCPGEWARQGSHPIKGREEEKIGRGGCRPSGPAKGLGMGGVGVSAGDSGGEGR